MLNFGFVQQDVQFFSESIAFQFQLIIPAFKKPPPEPKEEMTAEQEKFGADEAQLDALTPSTGKSTPQTSQQKAAKTGSDEKDPVRVIFFLSEGSIDVTDGIAITGIHLEIQVSPRVFFCVT